MLLLSEVIFYDEIILHTARSLFLMFLFISVPVELLTDTRFNTLSN